MHILNLIYLIGCFYENHDPIYDYFAFGGFIIIVYVIISRRKLKKLKSKKTETSGDAFNMDTDVLGMKKSIPHGIEHFTSLDKVMKWKTVLLVVLMIIGLYLVFTQGSTISHTSETVTVSPSGPGNAVIEQGESK